MQKMKGEWAEDDAAFRDLERFLGMEFPDGAPAFWVHFQKHVRVSRCGGRVSTIQLGYIRLALRTFA
tara:strand:- start:12541 stop:12741 length:201 start_codon:yes stop_codon:yes gene_type:complete